MSVTGKLSEQDFLSFESDLREALVRDPDHQFAFDGVLKVQSSRYRCLLRAVNVRWDERRGDAVFVGAFISGEPQPDYSRGYPLIKSEVEIPFRECFRDLERMGGFGGRYLLTKTRKAVIEKCLSHPLRVLSSYDAVEKDGSFLPDGFLDPSAGERPLSVVGGSVRVGSVRRDGKYVSVLGDDLRAIDLTKISLRDIQRIGERMGAARDRVKEARGVYVKARIAVVGEGKTVSERDDRLGSEAGLEAVYGAGYPMAVCRSVARTYCPEHEGVFDTVRHGMREIDAMVRAYRDGRGSFGEKGMSNQLRKGL